MRFDMLHAFKFIQLEKQLQREIG